MARRPTTVIAGAGLAGGRAAETLRAQGYDGRLVLIGSEPDRPYERPPLSKAYLEGRLARERVFLRTAAWYREQAITLRLGTTVTGVDCRRRQVQLDRGRPIGYDRLLLAPGARPRRLLVPGAQLEGVVALRTLADAERLRAAFAGRPRVVIVGAGFIGCEVAAAARRQGCPVTLLEVGAAPLAPALGPLAGAFVARLHRDHGVDLRTGESLVSLHGAERVEAVVTTSGRLLDADLVLIAVGAEPRTELAEAAGLACDGGIVVDECCRTSAADVFAAGDAARWWHPGLARRLRVEHYDNAQNQGVAAALSLLGRGAPYAPIPYVWSEQYDATLQWVGDAEGADRTVTRGDPASGVFSAFHLREGRVIACLAVNRFRDLAGARRLIAGGQAVGLAQLADPDTSLRDLLRAG
ncbi:MAG TPA: FAD-dependent oxidoreductase [Candidatus Micrarchaeia archaeon]|nr:FAD-dependent oxidoreductase [Candidatus Micrarchaeia archaeon]